MVKSLAPPPKVGKLYGFFTTARKSMPLSAASQGMMARMGQTIDTSQISHVARLLRNSAPAMPAPQDQRLFLKAAAALESRASKLTYGVPATSSGRLDLLV